MLVIVPSFPVLVVSIEQLAQQLPGSLRSERLGLTTPLILQRGQTGDKLQVRYAELFQVAIDLLRASGCGTSHNTEQIDVNAMLLHKNAARQRRSSRYTCPGAIRSLS